MISKENFQIFYEDLCKTIFGSFLAKYDFVYEDTKKVGFGIFTRFINNAIQTKIDIWFDIRDSYPDVEISNYLENVNEYCASISILKLLSIKAPQEKLFYNFQDSGQNIYDYLTSIYTRYAKAINEYGQDLLKGDFSILPAVINNNKQRMQVIQQEYGVVLTEAFANTFEEICKQAFQFLIDKYSFEFSDRTVDRETTVSCIFKNSTTAVIVFCSTLEVPPLISYEIIRLVNGQILDVSNPSFSIDDRVPFHALNLFSGNKELFNPDRLQRNDFDSTQDYLKAELNFYANNLEKFGQDVLQGDFSKIKCARPN